MKYLYSAVFTTDGCEKVYARVPDLPGCITTGNSLEDALEQITDAASLWLTTAEDDGWTVPPPTAQTSIPRGDGDTLSLIRVDTAAYRRLLDTMDAKGA